MKFDVTILDKERLVQTLYKHAFVRGYGVIQDKASGRKRELSKKEAAELIKVNTKDYTHGRFIILDYVHGRRIKLEIEVSNNRQIVDSWDYDYGNGRYRFLYALIAEFGSNSVLIKRKGYPAQFPKPKEMDIEEMEKEYGLFQLHVHFEQMIINLKLN